MIIQVFITTYNRPEKLKDLLNDINKFKGNHTVYITVIDDGSHEACNLPENISYFRFQKNNGKKNYHSVINKIFELRKNANYYIVLPDDVRLKDDFFNEAIRLWESIKNGRKISLNLLQDNRGNVCWTNFKAKNFGEVLLTQWNDLCFIANSNFFEVLKGVYSVKRQDFTKFGSGIGKQISLRLYKKRYAMFQVKETLVAHGNHESIMNKDLRQQKPLIAQ